MATAIENDRNDMAQLAQSVAVLAKSLEKSEKQNRRMQKMLLVAVLTMAVVVMSVFVPKTTFVNEAHATGMVNDIKRDVQRAGDLEQMLMQMMQQMGPALKDAGTLVARIKQDSDVARASVLMKHYPGRYQNINSIPESELNSTHASQALVIGSIAEEIRYLTATMRQMNHNMMVMTRDINDTMGVMGDMLP